MATQNSKKYVGNRRISSVGNLGSKLITFLMVPLFTNYLSTEQFGTAYLRTTTVNMLSPIRSLSIRERVFTFLMDDESLDQAIFTTGLTFTITVSLVLLFLYPVVVFFHIRNGGYILVYLTLVILQAYVHYFIRRILYVKLLRFNGIFRTLIMAVTGYYLIAVLKQGVTGYFTALIFRRLSSITLTFFGSTGWRFFSVN